MVAKPPRPVVESIGWVALHGHIPPVVAFSVGNKIRDTVVKETGFDPADILESPVHPPALQNVRAGISTLQLSLISGGMIVATVGLILFVFRTAPVFGALVAVLGGASVTLGVLVRVGQQV